MSVGWCSGRWVVCAQMLCLYMCRCMYACMHVCVCVCVEIAD